MSAPLLDVQGLSVTVRTPGGDHTVVNDVSFCVRAGEVLGIVGESGSGKSMSLLSLLDLLPPGARAQARRARFEETELLEAGASARRSVRGRAIGVVFQDPLAALNPVLSVGAQLDLPMQQHFRLTRGQRRERAMELLNRVGIPDPPLRLGQYPHELSGGLRQRVTLALALAGEPRLLVADEPTTALDVTVQAGIVALVQQLQRETGMAVIWVTHDLALLARLADRIVVFRQGAVVEEAQALDLFTAPRHPYTKSLLAAAGASA